MKHSWTFSAAIAGAVLSACTYSEINPDAALADIRANNGYDELRDVEPAVAYLSVVFTLRE